MDVKVGPSQSDRREEAQGKDASRRGWQLPGGTAGSTEELQQETTLEAVPVTPIWLPNRSARGAIALGSHHPPVPISRCACIFTRSPTDSQHQVMPQVLLGAQ